MPLEGLKSYKPRIVAYRNDYCLSCEAPSRAHQIRSFKVYQLYYIPVVPLGFWREWQCAECQRDPHNYPGTSRKIWWLAVIFAGFFAITGIITSFEQQDSALTVWVMRLAFPALFFVVLWLAVRRKPDKGLREKLQQISPDRDNKCALCNGALVLNQGWNCSQCGVARTAL